MPPLESLETSYSSSPSSSPSQTLTSAVKLLQPHEEPHPEDVLLAGTDASRHVVHVGRKTAAAPPQPKKRVDFCNHVYIFRVPDRTSFTPEEVLNAWFTDEEYDGIRRHRQLTMEKMRWGETIAMDDAEYCDVGLYTSSETARRESFILYAQRAVWEEQDYQWELATKNHDHTAAAANAAAEVISESYYEATCDMQWEAYERGVWLAEDLELLDLLCKNKKEASRRVKKNKKSHPSKKAFGAGASAVGTSRRLHCSAPLQRLSLTRALSLRSAETMLSEMLAVVGCF